MCATVVLASRRAGGTNAGRVDDGTGRVSGGRCGPRPSSLIPLLRMDSGTHAPCYHTRPPRSRGVRSAAAGAPVRRAGAAGTASRRAVPRAGEDQARRGAGSCGGLGLLLRQGSGHDGRTARGSPSSRAAATAPPPQQQQQRFRASNGETRRQRHDATRGRRRRRRPQDAKVELVKPAMTAAVANLIMAAPAFAEAG
eukprot:351790-Chlamydomonas_euryale.AAC.1